MDETSACSKKIHNGYNRKQQGDKKLCKGVVSSCCNPARPARFGLLQTRAMGICLKSLDQHISGEGVERSQHCATAEK
jgi:hypothetical protein